jgi:hypothetical protein
LLLQFKDNKKAYPVWISFFIILFIFLIEVYASASSSSAGKTGSMLLAFN